VEGLGDFRDAMLSGWMGAGGALGSGLASGMSLEVVLGLPGNWPPG